MVDTHSFQKVGMFDRGDQLNNKDFEGSGADWFPRYKKYINKGFCNRCGTP